MNRYIVIYKNSQNIYDSEYITLKQATEFIKNYKHLYVFRFKSTEHILYINYPISTYYSSSTINIIKHIEDIENSDLYDYIEIRITDKYPSIRLGTNIKF